MSLIDQIKQANDLKTEPVEIPEWGMTITVRELSGKERAKFENDVQAFANSEDSGDLIKSMALMIARCAIHEGKPAFTDDDVEVLCDKSMAVIKKIFDKALEVNALTEKDLEDLEKN